MPLYYFSENIKVWNLTSLPWKSMTDKRVNNILGKFSILLFIH